MRSIIILLTGMMAAAVHPCLAQGFGNDCTPAGTWYGGSVNGAKYLLTVKN